jgi:formiminotetrahydrofolate cyclodeaminase
MPGMTDDRRRFRHQTIEEFTTALASGDPVPGGGSAAAVAAALAASLCSMVVRLSLQRPALQMHATLHAEGLAASEAARSRLLDLADEDSTAYATYRQARRMPSTSDEESAARDAATRQAARESAEVPLAVVGACRAQADVAERLVGRTNRHAASDLDVAALLLEASARAAAANVIVNLPAIGDDDLASDLRRRVEHDLQRVEASSSQIRNLVATGAQRPPEQA